MKLIDYLLEQLKENRKDIYDKLNDLETMDARTGLKIALIGTVLTNIGIVFLAALALMLLWNFISVNIFSSTSISYQISLAGVFVFNLIYYLWINPIFSIDFYNGKNEEDEE